MKRKLSSLRIGILHSIIGKNDGVSIVIDDTVKAMLDKMEIPLGNIFFLSAHSPSRFQVTTDEVFWHKNDINRMAVSYFSGKAPDNFESKIREYANYAKRVIRSFVETNEIDLLIAHNTSHIYNFITAVGLGQYIEENRAKGVATPKVICWWHDSHYERDQFKTPNEVMSKYIKYLPGTYVDGVVFINSVQPEIAKRYFKTNGIADTEKFFQERTRIIPNTCDITWNWEDQNWNSKKLVFPPQAQYNRSFFKDIGLISELRKRYMTIGNAVLLLQHTRIVPRKRIEVAIDFAFKLEERFRKHHKRDKCVVLLISGHSGDEQNAYKRSLRRYFNKLSDKNPTSKVMMIFGEDKILPEREIIVDRKFYRFYDIPSIVASAGGIGTYFSEVEGYGNNLLEMIRFGLPVVVNEYDIYKRDIAQLGFDLPLVKNCELTDEVVDRSYELLTDYKKRNAMVRNNLSVLAENLNSNVIAKYLTPLIKKAFS